MKKKSHILILMVLLLFIYPSISFSKTIDETKQYASELALKSAIQKELFEIITEDTNEMLKNDLESGVIKNLNKTVKNEFIFNFVNKICLLEKLKKCPDIY
jgi:competence protein ComGC